MNKSRYPEFEKDSNGNPLCRGCKKIVKKPRRTWCSQACVEKYHPWNVKNAVWKRDNGTCQKCFTFLGVIGKSGKLLNHNSWYHVKKPLNFDHVIPYCEGGETIAENMQVLCVDCHKKKTAEWHKQRKKDDEKSN